MKNQLGLCLIGNFSEVSCANIGGKDWMEFVFTPLSLLFQDNLLVSIDTSI